MIRPFLPTSLPILLGLLLTSLPAFAQLFSFEEYSYCDSVHDAVHRDASVRLGRLLADFWEPRLNVCRLRINRILSSRDLSDLNELRARFALAYERGERYREFEARRFEELAPLLIAAALDTSAVDTVSSPSAETDIRFVIQGRRPGDAAGIPGYEDARRDPKAMEEEWEENDKVEMMRNTADMFIHHQELSFELPVIASWIMRNHHSLLDSLVDDMVTDLRAFADSAEYLIRNLEGEYRDAFISCPDLREVLVEDFGIAYLRAVSQQPDMFQPSHRERVESLIPLYTGQPLASLVDMISNKEVPPTDVFPQEPPLRQISSNPISTSVEIAYTLPGVSSRTNLNIIDARGEVVLTAIQGVRNAGEHSVTVDVSELPTGPYIYRLTTDLPSGQRVWSRVMEVVR